MLAALDNQSMTAVHRYRAFDHAKRQEQGEPNQLALRKVDFVNLDGPEAEVAVILSVENNPYRPRVSLERSLVHREYDPGLLRLLSEPFKLHIRPGT